MDWPSIQARLNDLPDTFKRSGAPYVWLVNAMTAGLHKGGNAVDGVMAQAQFQNASDKWLNVWGQLLNLPRNANEGNEVFSNRIVQTLVGWKGPPNAIVAYLLNVLGLRSAVVETLPTVGWSVNFHATQAATTYNQIALNLANVRPAGVPFGMNVLAGGLFLGTSNYLGRPLMTGAYLTEPVTPVALGIPASTNNAQPTLPTVLLSDPILNPSLA